MTVLRSDEARLKGRVGGLATIVRYGSDAIAARARAGLRARFEREADPNGDLPIAERQRRADLVQRAYYARLALQSAQARRRNPTIKNRQPQAAGSSEIPTKGTSCVTSNDRER